MSICGVLYKSYVLWIYKCLLQGTVQFDSNGSRLPYDTRILQYRKDSECFPDGMWLQYLWSGFIVVMVPFSEYYIGSKSGIGTICSLAIKDISTGLYIRIYNRSASISDLW